MTRATPPSYEPTFYTTPPNTEGCRNFNPVGPTPCWHPHCDCFSDSVPAVLSRGSFEVPASVYKKYGPDMLAQLNGMIGTDYDLIVTPDEPDHWEDFDRYMLMEWPKAPRPPHWTARILTALAVFAILFYFIYPAVASEPIYCKPLEKFERSCTGVKMAVATLGKERAISIAKKCGATETDIAQAEDCLRIPFTPPEKQ